MQSVPTLGLDEEDAHVGPPTFFKVRFGDFDEFVGVLDRWRALTNNGPMSSDEISAYLDALEEPQRATLQKLRETIAEIIPEAEQGISYRLPAFRLNGKVIAGFAAFKNHLSYLPHSGSVFVELEGDLAAYSKSIGALHFPIDEPLPKEIVRKLIDVRMLQAFPK